MTSAPSKAAASLSGPDGRAVAPEALEVATADLDPAEAAAAQASARRSGRVLERDGLALYGLGLAAALELPGGLAAPGAATAAADLLRSLPGPAGAAVAVGALPFDRAAPGRLAIPSVAIRSDQPPGQPGRARAIVVAPPGKAEGVLARLRAGDQALLAEANGGGPATGGELPDRFELASTGSHRAFRRLVAEAVAAIEAGRLDKVVLARQVEVVANRPFRQDDLLGRLRALHPSCAAFAVDGFVGASPELLCRRRGLEVTSVPLAGTVARSGDPDEDARLARALAASPKEQAEHGLVVRAIVEALEGVAGRVEAAPVPSVMELRNVAHLATAITATLDPPAAGPAPSALALAAALHPTPAVGGWPVAEALAYLADHESLRRDRFAGPVGYLDAGGDGEWWVGIRSALIEGPRARLLAGVGVVAGSDPAAELAETQLKLQALLAVAVRP